jgi:hypothetical protein
MPFLYKESQSYLRINRSLKMAIYDPLPWTSHIDEILPNFIERKHLSKGEKRKQGARTEVRASKQPNQGGPARRKGNH